MKKGLKLCEYCRKNLVLPPQMRYCGIDCYNEAKRIRERRPVMPLRGKEKIIPCLGHLCKGALFTSRDPVYNRICDRCQKSWPHMGTNEGMHI
jgi:hypothetical protein